MARGWSFPVTLQPSGRRGARTPVYAQIAEALAADIARGRLRPGQALPGTRSLADTLGVHRSTVLAAYAELQAQGLTVTRRAGATLVAPGLRTQDQQDRRDHPQLGRSSAPAIALAPRWPPGPGSTCGPPRGCPG